MIPQDYLKTFNNYYEFNYTVTLHCNLNCKGCRLFSPIQDKYEISMKQVLEDIKNLKRIGFSDKNLSLNLFGGEPLIHRGIESIIRVIPFNLGLLTNAKFLQKNTPSLFKTLKSKNIKPCISYYPNSRINYDLVHKNLDMYNIEHVNVQQYSAVKVNEYKDTFIISRIDTQGRYNTIEQFDNCKSFMPMIFEGKLFKCHIFSLKALEKFDFKYDLVKHKDYIELSDINNIAEIREFLKDPCEFCRYCGSDGVNGSKNINEEIKWTFSKREKSEWF